MTTEEMPENVKRVYDHLRGYFAELELLLTLAHRRGYTLKKKRT